MLSEAWPDQYHRMQRSFARLHRMGGSPSSSTPDANDARDSVYHFCQDALHLMDWIRNEPATGHLWEDLKALFKGSVELAACADIANGSKHLKLNRPAWSSSGTYAEVTGQGVTVHMATGRATYADGVLAHHEVEGGWAHLTWTVTANGLEYDVQDLAIEAVAAWDTWLRARGADWAAVVDAR